MQSVYHSRKLYTKRVFNWSYKLQIVFISLINLMHVEVLNETFYKIYNWLCNT